MLFDFQTLSAGERYKILTATVAPRPIAWVTTRSLAGIVNAAPYSFFNVMGSDPPMVALGILAHETKSLKDTALNIEQTGAFVVNLVNEMCAPQMNQTASDLPLGVSEVSLAQLETHDCLHTGLPRIATSPVSLECTLFQSIATSPRQRVILGLVVAAYIHDDLVMDVERMHIDIERHQPVGRMGGSSLYSRTHDRFVMHRP